jgi:hypothetical protein
VNREPFREEKPRRRLFRIAVVGVAAAGLAGAGLVALMQPSSAAVIPSATHLGAARTVFAVSATNSLGTKSATARCPRGLKVASGGATLSTAQTGSRGVRIVGAQPITSSLVGDRFVARASEEDTGFAWNWRLTAVAVCIRAPRGYEVRTAASAFNTARFKAVNVSCSPGKKLIGLGGDTSAGSQTQLHQLAGSSNLTSVRVRALVDETGFRGSCRARAFAVCANLSYGQKLGRVVSERSSAVRKAANARCPIGTSVYGAGANIVNAPGQINLDTLRSSGASTSTGRGMAGASEDKSGFARTWFVETQAICARR